ncbi:MAG: flagellar M-ring protein FliF [Bradymonadales bacterium]|nr:MAG: flagellar M-ring protein FliF [Bradymonadales bacterium]
MEFILNFSSWFKTLPASGKISLFLVVIGAITAGILLQTHVRHSGYQYLYTNLSLSDSNMIAERLQSMNVQAQLRGDSILVPGNRVLELRNMLASEGLPKGGGTGFEIFDESRFGATEFEQRVNYMRAIQGELARTISAIDGVDSARVHVVIPERTLFRDESEQPRASVALTLHRGRRLSSSQVSGIVHLLLTSVQGLTEANLNVIDQNGNTLFKGSGSDSAGLSARHLEMRRSLESNLESRVVSMLERVVGTGRVSVSVSADMNFSQVERTIESIDPESRVAISEQSVQDQSSGSSGGAGGAPGAATNLPGGAGAEGGAGRSETSRRTETSATYAVSKTIQRILEPVGNVNRLSVAVLVDGRYEEVEGADGEIQVNFQPRGEEEVARIEELVRRAIGFDATRGDEVKVDSLQFDRVDTSADLTPEFVSAINSNRMMVFIMDNAVTAALVLIFGIIFLLLVRMVNSYAPPMEVAYANIIGESAGSVAKALPSGANVNIVKRDDEAAKQKAEEISSNPEISAAREPEIEFVETKRPIRVEAPTTSEEKLRFQAAKMQAEQIINTNVDEALRVMRSWMQED